MDLWPRWLGHPADMLNIRKLYAIRILVKSLEEREFESLQVYFFTTKMKCRKHGKVTGWTYPESTVKGKKAEIIAECLDPEPFWDDWNDFRDGFRGYPDNTKIQKRTWHWWNGFNIPLWNKKNKLLLKRRKAMKLMRGV